MYIYIMSKHLLTIALCCLAFLLGNPNMKAQNNSSKPLQTLKQPPYLKAGDTVAIVAPSGILKNRNTEIEQAKTLLKSWGLHPVVGKHVFKQNNHFAGTDAERCEDFQNALDDPKSEEHTSELQSRENLVCRLLLEKKNRTNKTNLTHSFT